MTKRTASERAWGPLNPTAVPQGPFRPTLRDPPTTKRYPEPKAATGRESAAVARALSSLGKGARR